MPFENIRGLPGKVYVPEESPDALKKHRCKDCFSCQICSDDRCRVCRNHTGGECCDKTEKPDEE